jgi:cytochrome c-type biogenesis protein CcmF
MLAGGMPPGGAWLTFVGGVFAMGTIVQEFWRGMRARQAMLRESAPQALGRLVAKNRRRYGGYIIHIGIVSMFVGIAASSMFRTEVQQTLKAGEEARIGRYTLRYDRIETQEDGHVQRLIAVLPVFVDGRQIDVLEPEKRFYKKPKQPTTEVANRSTLREDLYVVLGAYDPKTEVITILGYVNPLVVWIWLGGLILALGTLVAVWPTATEREARVVSPGAARAAVE